MAVWVRLFRKPALLGLLLAFAVLHSACGAEFLTTLSEAAANGLVDNSTRPAASTVAPDSSTAASDVTTATTIVQPYATAAAAASSGTTAASLAFDDQVGGLLLDGLQNRQRDIDLSGAVRGRRIAEADVQATISRIYSIYSRIYSQHAEFFYLNGAINISYTLIKDKTNMLDALTVKPQYWTITQDLPENRLTSLINQVNAIADQLAAEIRAETSVLWRQLLLVHDYLVSNIAYDTGIDQEKNQAISALLEKSTMCQGYAQSFQLIAQRLGFEVWMISGTVDGVGHAWDLVKLDGAYYHVDATHDDPTPDGGADKPVQHINFLRSDDQMQLTHEWAKADYPACPQDGAQYYLQNKLVVADQAALEKMINVFLKGIDYGTSQSNLLELLFTGADLPLEDDLQKMVQQALKTAGAGHSVYYRQQVTKSVVLVEITPE